MTKNHPRTLSTGLVALLSLAAGSASAVPCDHVDDTIDCGDTVSVEMPSATVVMDDYGFVSGYDAGEYVLEWTAPMGISRLDVVHASLADNAVFLMGPNSCDSDDTGWWSNTGNGSIESGLTGGDTFFLSVDAEAGIPSGSWISVSFMCDLTPYENCFMSGDEDGDGLEECDDPNCFDYVGCLTQENCSNTIDDDGDGLVDCDDPDCGNFGACNQEDCTDGIDNNNDGLVDCDDPWCVFQGLCPETECNDLQDNDGDGLTDCQDSDCPNFPCPEEDCNNGLDDDIDGWIDCDDISCLCDPVCWGGEVCDNGLDDDGDGATDCADCECFEVGFCLGEICDNNIDDEGDGFVDCDDPECETHPSCEESETGACNDFVDNDLDGLTDCEDPDCLDDEYCTGECDIIAELSCGESYSWTSVGENHTDIFHDHSDCGISAPAYNPETSFSLPDAEILQVVVTTTAGGLDAVVLVEDPTGAGCSTELECVASADPGEPLTYESSDGSALYAIVESDGFATEFEITVTCFLDSEDCDAAGDQDGDGLDDCEDDDCSDHDFADKDGDGYDLCDDCDDDDDDTIHPGAEDMPCDDIDQDCDGGDDVLTSENCYDGLDNDCNDLIDEEDPDCSGANGFADDTANQGCSCTQGIGVAVREGSRTSLALLIGVLALVARRRNVQGRTK